MRKSIKSITAVFLMAFLLSGEIMAGTKVPDLPDPGELAADAARQAKDIASGFAQDAQELLSDWGEAAGETSDDIKEKLADAGVKIKDSGMELKDAGAQKAKELTDKAGKTVDDAMNAVSDLSGLVVDKFGHVVDLASAGSAHLSSEAAAACSELKEKGSELMEIAASAVDGIDISAPENWEKAKAAVDEAIENAYELEIIDNEKISKETVQLISDMVFGTMIYGYRFLDGQITLGEYVGSMSELLIRKGLPVGAVFIASNLPVKIPGSESLAKEAAYYMIALAYGDKAGDEIEAEEDMFLKGLTGEETEAEREIIPEGRAGEETEAEREIPECLTGEETEAETEAAAAL